MNAVLPDEIISLAVPFGLAPPPGRRNSPGKSRARKVSSLRAGLKRNGRARPHHPPIEICAPPAGRRESMKQQRDRRPSTLQESPSSFGTRRNRLRLLL